MKALTSVMSAVALVMGVTLFTGCDQSKEELDKTKLELAKVTTERDMMKGQIDKATQEAKDAMAKLADAEKGLKDANDKLATCQPAVDPAAAGKPAAAAAAKRPTKPAAASLPVAPKPDAAAPVGSPANPVQLQPGTRRGAM